MRRRTILKAVGASGIISMTAGAASATSRAPIHGSIETLDALHVVRDGSVVRTVKNPTSRELAQLEASLDDEESLVTPTDECATHCKEDCDTVCGGGDCWYAEDCSTEEWCCK